MYQAAVIALLNRRIVTAPTPTRQNAELQLKLRAVRLLHHTTQPEQVAERMLVILTTPQRMIRPIPMAA